MHFPAFCAFRLHSTSLALSDGEQSGGSKDLPPSPCPTPPPHPTPRIVQLQLQLPRPQVKLLSQTFTQHVEKQAAAVAQVRPRWQGEAGGGREGGVAWRGVEKQAASEGQGRAAMKEGGGGGFHPARGSRRTQDRPGNRDPKENLGPKATPVSTPKRHLSFCLTPVCGEPGARPVALYREMLPSHLGTRAGCWGPCQGGPVPGGPRARGARARWDSSSKAICITRGRN